MKKNILFLAMLLATASGTAQDIYKVETLTSEDLNGTARFIGMGGAMGALGADITTMSTNPAGIGLFRKSDLNLSFSYNSQKNAESTLGKNPSYMSFDNIGLVYSSNVDGKVVKFVNFGFNYHKRKNFRLMQSLMGASLNGYSQSAEMLDLSTLAGGSALNFKQNDDDNTATDYTDNERTSPMAWMGYDVGMLTKNVDANGNVSYTPYSVGNRYNFQSAQWGGISQYDFNISTNLLDRVYIGLAVGVYDVNYHYKSQYEEFGNTNGESYLTTSNQQISGNGVDFKMGAIVRPVVSLPIRIGFYFSTPTFYDISSKGDLHMSTNFLNSTSKKLENYYWDYSTPTTDFKITTPWKVGLAIGGTIGSSIALDAEYEFSKYSGSSVKYQTYDANGNTYEGNDYEDSEMNNAISSNLKPVHTFRLGAECKIIDNLYFRIGYNHITAPMKTNASLDLSYGSYFKTVATETAYTNLGATNRYTAGFGYHGKHFYVDMAYMYQKQNTEFYPFYHTENGINVMSPQQSNITRQSVSATLGVRF